MQIRSVYQDRLGTNVGKTLEEKEDYYRTVILQGDRTVLATYGSKIASLLEPLFETTLPFKPGQVGTTVCMYVCMCVLCVCS